MRIAVDGMGGDHAPKEIIRGCIEGINEIDDIEIFLTGQKDLIEKELKKYQFDHNRIQIVHTSEVITNDDKPVKAVRKKKDSSMVVGLNLLKERKVDAFISAGNTGALLAGSLFRLGRIKGIDRPAIASVYPTTKGISLLLDAGANAECKPRNLLEFGLMGSLYVEKVLEKEHPSVGLANIGIEEGKGTQLIRESFELFKKTDLNFCGNAEVRDLPNGIVDVIVCDGFVGNVILKLTEGVAMTIMSMMKEVFTKNMMNKIGAMLLKGSLKEFKKNLDYTEYGGAPLLGVNGAVIKAHGSSNAKAIKNAIKQAKIFAEKEVIEVINREIHRIGDENNGE
ncbi:phosphate acyltransferase PlsX [Crassaminicella profunda]|uniref:phosphate acyltransferase PlsX n=1 Tax=Crassaminicella profunda TaxID=1286698 RepID=UPI001CA7AC03|nr:phosphate acyltransferase PlsX [Crassaminicella profunda]QZY57101.1 phosphate acyltransferase PlsX [Crassaminicella profunda]